MKKKLQARKIQILPNRMLYPIIFALGFIPLIVHSYEYDVGWQDIPWFPLSANEQNDFFFMWKSIAIMATGAAMLLLLIWQYSKTLTLRIERIFIPLAAYATFVILSAVCSPYKPQVFSGSYEVLQPMGTMLGYLVICYYTYCLADNEQKVSVVLHYSIIGICILVLIGTFQAAGLDFFRSTLGRLTIMNPSDWEHLDRLDFTFAKDRVYATLYNPDFLSFYFGLLLPVMAAMLIAARKKAAKAILLIACILSIVCVIKADITSGYLAILIAAAVGAYIQLSRRKKTFIIGLAVAAAALICGLFVCLLTPIGPKMQALFFGTIRFEDTRLLKTMETKNDGIYMNIDGQILVISYTYDANTGNFQAIFRDADGSPLESELVKMDNESYGFQLSDSAYGDILAQPVYIDEILCIGIRLDGYDWYFTNQLGGTYYYYNAAGKFDKASIIPYAGLFYDNAMTDRGYIWNLTIPQLPKYIFIGSGSNSFARAYPQDDYIHKVYRENINKTRNVFDLKAHNWFLQEWVEQGLLGTLCLFGFYLWYFIRSVRIYRRCNMRDTAAIIGFGILLGTVGYVSAGFASDANVCTAPPFWVMMGLGMSVNRMLAGKIDFSKNSKKVEQ